MNKFLDWLPRIIAILLILALIAIAKMASGATFNTYTPANGIQKNTGTSSTNTAASGADLAALFNGICAATNPQTGTTYTLVLSDANTCVTMNNINPNTVTIPTNASVALPIGTRVIIQQIGAGNTVVTPAGGVTINGSPGNNTITGDSIILEMQQFGMVYLRKTATDTWNLDSTYTSGLNVAPTNQASFNFTPAGIPNKFAGGCVVNGFCTAVLSNDDTGTSALTTLNFWNDTQDGPFFGSTSSTFVGPNPAVPGTSGFWSWIGCTSGGGDQGCLLVAGPAPGAVANLIPAGSTPTEWIGGLNVVDTDLGQTCSGTGCGLRYKGVKALTGFTGTTAAIGGSLLAPGACAAGTATATGATSAMVATASPSADPDSTLSTGIAIYAFVSSANTVTVRVCAIVSVTPAAVTYNVRVIQ